MLRIFKGQTLKISLSHEGDESSSFPGVLGVVLRISDQDHPIDEVNVLDVAHVCTEAGSTSARDCFTNELFWVVVLGGSEHFLE